MLFLLCRTSLLCVKNYRRHLDACDSTGNTDGAGRRLNEYLQRLGERCLKVLSLDWMFAVLCRLDLKSAEYVVLWAREAGQYTRSSKIPRGQRGDLCCGAKSHNNGKGGARDPPEHAIVPHILKAQAFLGIGASVVCPAASS